MGDLETRSRKRLKKETLKKVVLRTIAVTGLLSVALIAPKALQILKLFDIKPYKRRKELIKRTYEKLIEQELLIKEDRYIKITDKGVLALRLLDEGKAKLKVPKKWDKKWRVLIFDVSENKRPTRDKLRRSLISAGFFRLQDSVWVYPYDCEDFVALLKKDFKLGKEILYLIVEEIEGDLFLRQKFGLPTRID